MNGFLANTGGVGDWAKAAVPNAIAAAHATIRTRIASPFFLFQLGLEHGGANVNLPQSYSDEHLKICRHPDRSEAESRGPRMQFSYVYTMASRRNGTLYTGVTSDLVLRVSQHRQGLIEGFTKTYGVKTLVWFETHNDITEAIRREKQIKRWRRAWKLALIEKDNPDWRDLWFELVGAEP